MTLLSAFRATKVLGLAVVLAAGGMTAAEARDGWHNGHHRHHTPLPPPPNLAQGERARAGTPPRRWPCPRPSRGPGRWQGRKVITVMPGVSGCALEAGVCVIRPGP